MKIKVTQRDIDLANKKIKKYTYCENCPVALAIKRKTHKKCGVQRNRITIYKNWVPFSITTPNSVRVFIDRFDSNRKVKPFSFELV